MQWVGNENGISLHRPFCESRSTKRLIGNKFLKI